MLYPGDADTALKTREEGGCWRRDMDLMRTGWRHYVVVAVGLEGRMSQGVDVVVGVAVVMAAGVWVSGLAAVESDVAPCRRLS